jgi:hypothetical protein
MKYTLLLKYSHIFLNAPIQTRAHSSHPPFSSPHQVREPSAYLRVSEHIPHIIAYVQGIERNGFAYRIPSSEGVLGGRGMGEGIV